MKISAYNIEKALLQFLLRMIGLLPLAVHHFNAKWIAFLMERVVKYRVALVDANLFHAFPEKSSGERLQVRHEFYGHFARIIVEAIWFGACRNPQRLVNAKIVSNESIDELNEIFAKSPSIMLLSSHTGNWELIGGIVHYNYSGKASCISEQNFCVSYRNLTSRVWNEILESTRFAPLKDREHFGGYLESRNVVSYIFRHKDEKKIYDMITDQRPYFHSPNFVRVNFMNRECNTMSAAAALAIKFSMAVMYLRMREDSIGHYKLEFVPVCDNASLMKEDEIMTKYYEMLEADIRTQPFNYLWTHNRWG